MAVAARQPLETDISNYSPEFVDRWLTRWDLLVSLAESPRTSAHHLRLGHGERHGSCHEEPRLPGGRSSDGLTWSVVRADLESAAAALAVGSVARQVVYARINGGGSLGHVALLCRTRKATVVDAYQTAITRMAETLGWEPDCAMIDREPETR